MNIFSTHPTKKAKISNFTGLKSDYIDIHSRKAQRKSFSFTSWHASERALDVTVCYKLHLLICLGLQGCDPLLFTVVEKDKMQLRGSKQKPKVSCS